MLILMTYQAASQFEAKFDDRAGGTYTITYFLGEPVLYHPGHLAKPVFTHIELIADGFFVVGNSTTGRMIPFGQAQRVLKVKLTVDDMEREVYGGELDAAERLLWRRWVANENARQFRKSRVQVTCCGRFRYRYQIEQDEHGNWWCDACWNAVPMCRPAADPAHEATLPAPDRKEDAVEVVDESPESPRVPPGDAAAGSAPEKSSRREDWRWETGKRATKRRRHALTGAVDFWNQHHGYGYARFDGHHERVLFHAKDCIDVGTPSAGAAVSAFVHRRRDGKLQAFKVMSDCETMKGRLD